MLNITKEEKVNLAIDIFIKIGLLSIVLYVSFLILKPFIAIVAWGIIIAVALSPVINKLQTYYDNRKLIIIGFTALIIAALIVPTYMLSNTMITSSQEIISDIENGGLHIPPPNEKVKEWPVMGEQAYAFWDEASHNLRKTLAPFSQDIKSFASTAIGAFGSGISTILMFIGSLIIAAIFLFNKEKGLKFYTHLLKRVIGSRADEWANLSTLTIRSVVTGVIGVAIIQAFFALIGLALMKVPFAIVWALLIMFLTIIQVPALLVIGPVIAYVFSQGSGTPEIIFTIYMLIVGASDGVLKPLLMGRGVDVPMLVILIGAIGGMILMGMIGLFVGAVIFALTYELFLLWVNEDTLLDETA